MSGRRRCRTAILTMSEAYRGIIFKALSGFYYVEPEAGGGLVECRGRGLLRKLGVTPLVGDRVEYTVDGTGAGTVQNVLERRNSFVRPAVANIDCLVAIAAAVNPITDPFLIDRVAAIAEYNDCDTIVCINKCDINPGDELFDTYTRAGFTTVRASAGTGQGKEELLDVLGSRVAAFTGNSGVGKSSILNMIDPGFGIRVGEVSEKLGRGRHTTRHVELFRLKSGAIVADTPGFSAFGEDVHEFIPADQLQYAFRDFEPFLGSCLFSDCAHVKDKGCAVLEAVEAGEIPGSRHSSYARMYEQARQVNEWELKRD